MTTLVPVESIISRIIFLRGEKVLLDRDLARPYGVQTKALKQAVRRNAKLFPDDFMFELTKEEFENWRSQFVTFNGDRGHVLILAYRAVSLIIGTSASLQIVSTTIE